jgi:hypothetical protein
MMIFYKKERETQIKKAKNVPDKPDSPDKTTLIINIQLVNY